MLLIWTYDLKKTLIVTVVLVRRNQISYLFPYACTYSYSDRISNYCKHFKFHFSGNNKKNRIWIQTNSYCREKKKNLYDFIVLDVSGKTNNDFRFFFFFGKDFNIIGHQVFWIDWYNQVLRLLNIYFKISPPLFRTGSADEHHCRRVMLKPPRK